LIDFLAEPYQFIIYFCWTCLIYLLPTNLLNHPGNATPQTLNLDLIDLSRHPAVEPVQPFEALHIGSEIISCTVSTEKDMTYLEENLFDSALLLVKSFVDLGNLLEPETVRDNV
jgi:hypothetical protein